ncbi:hypothetical protein OAN61_00560 [bacterium]|nr:hypothetical protein [bacterium]
MLGGSEEEVPVVVVKVGARHGVLDSLPPRATVPSDVATGRAFDLARVRGDARQRGAPGRRCV